MNATTLTLTREWFRDNALACIAEVESGAVTLASHYPLARYRAEMLARADAAMAGEFDRSLTFQQRAQWIETGTCQAMLP